MAKKICIDSVSLRLRSDIRVAPQSSSLGIVNSYRVETLVFAQGMLQKELATLSTKSKNTQASKAVSAASQNPWSCSDI